MGIVSLQYLFFLTLVFLAYFLCPKRHRWCVLLAASWVFYAVCGLTYLPFLAVVTLSTWLAARAMGRIAEKAAAQMAALTEREKKRAVKAAAQKKKRRVIAVCLAVDFGILATLKYLNFFVGLLGGEPLELLMPLGLSFYTFQAAGYVIDVYRSREKPEPNLAKYALFVSFFPQLVQGPISRHDSLAGQLYEGHDFDFVRARSALRLMAWGYFKKCLVADKLAVAVAALFDAPAEHSGCMAAFAALCYGVQIYADFSGGIDVVRGVGQFLGVDMEQNFNQPYFAVSIADFWRRWHITLGNWMRSYIFYPLALSKRMTRLGRRLSDRIGAYAGKAIPLCLASLVTFLLVGIWHGAGWKYIAYGLWNGVLISIGTLTEPVLERFYEKRGINSGGWILHLLRILRTFLLVTVGRFLVRAADLKTAFFMLGRVFSAWNDGPAFAADLLELGVDGKNLLVAACGVGVMLLVGILRERGKDIRAWIEARPVWLQLAGEFVFALILIVLGEYGAEYDPADFIYMVF